MELHPPEAEAASELLRERAYREIKNRLALSINPPEPFLSERKLALQLGMSNTPVRSAIERLAVEGLIIISPQQGIIMRELSAKEITDQYEMRQAVEPFVLRRLAGKLTADQGRRLRAHLKEQEQSARAGDAAKFVELDSAFHLLFCEFLANDEILRTMRQLRDRIHRLVLRMVRHAPASMSESHADHARVTEAVLRGDGKPAARLVIEHLEKAKRALAPLGTP
ncbi:MAG TPA: GntR family transcriptional regulator [Armatimonadota bacterium]|nr:GntR family transcriptional regulator [Armatimonadota bacterium]